MIPNEMKGASTGADDFISAHYLDMSVRQIAASLHRSRGYVLRRMATLGRHIPPNILQQRREQSRMAAGNTPPNKGLRREQYLSAEALASCKRTQFARGHAPVGRVYEVGHISRRTDAHGNQYLYIRTECGAWRPLHHIVWALYHGPVPKGHLITFIDGNAANCKLGNLECITQAEHMRRNSYLQHDVALVEIMRIRATITRRINFLVQRRHKGGI